MARFQSPRRSDEEWFQLINECRRSGLSDSLWCRQQAIPVSSFFCAVRRLREKAYALPERKRSIDIVSNPLPCQDVVRIDIEPNPFTVKDTEPLQVIPATHLDNSHTVEIEVHGINIRIFNGVDTGLLKTVLSSLGGAGC
ncbi:MAG: IS66 family insertion sequence element accessory protein TnpA [Lachnospiraceae bacterium]